MALYRLKTIRLINFHNFTDVEIPVRGHLFLVGDNASGKTTVLDAVQWVLSGGQDLEFNAAASLWGRKEEGRTLRGAVLRYDSERGVMNVGRTITYAALELEAEKGDLLTLGMGAELAHQDAELRTWGFLYPGPLAEVSLLKSPNGSEGQRPLTRDELREALGGERVFFQSGRYKKLVAAKLTRGEEAYDRLTWFWKVSKAYKQMASETRDYSQLLRDLLPAPDGAPFLQVASGLAALAGIEERLQALQAQRAYLERLTQWTERVAGHREEVARYDYMLALRERTGASEQLKKVQADLERAAEELARTEKERLRARDRLRSLDSQVLDLRAKDKEGLVNRRIALERELADGRSASEQAKKAADAASMELARAGKQLAKTRRDLVAAVEQFSAALGRHSGIVRSVGELAAQLKAASKDVAPETAWAEVEAEPARQEALALQRTESASRAQAQEARLKVELELKEAEAKLERLEKTIDPLPEIGRYADCLARLAEKSLKFVPLYRVLEKVEQADEALFRDLEAVLGQRALAAIVPEPEDASEVARIVLRDFPGIPVVRTDLPPPETGATWLEKILAWNHLPLEARGYLLRLCGSSENGGLRLDGAGLAEHWGARLRVEPLSAPLMGARARQEAHRKRKEEAKGRVQELRGQKAEWLGRERAHEEKYLAAGALLAILSGFREGERGLAERACLAAAAAEVRARDRQKAAKESWEAAAARAETLASELKGVQTRLAASGLDALEDQLRALERERGQAEARQRELDKRAGELENEQENLGRTNEELAERLRQTEARVDDCAGRLRPLVAPEHAAELERYVLEIRQGRQFTRVSNIQERRDEALRAEARAAADIEGEGGVLHPQYGGLFGLTYAKEVNAVVERKGEPLARLLESFSAQVAENEKLLDEGRRKLFEEVMLGDLARSLRGQIADLEETVRGVNQLLKQRVFGERTRYGIIVRTSPEHTRFVNALKRLAAFDAASQEEFKAELTERLKSLPQDSGPLPPAFDYRHWFEFQLKMTTHTEQGVVLEPKIARLGSGGEQAVPKYLIILAMASLLFRMSDAAIRVLLFDEVFYGVDQARREELLRLATELDLQLVVASPEQAGDQEAYRKATTVFLVKDAENDVHMAVNHFWTDAPMELFGS